MTIVSSRAEGLGFLASTYWLVDGDPGYSAPCDFYGDGDVDGMDLAEYANRLD